MTKLLLIYVVFGHPDAEAKSSREGDVLCL